ncbi:MAG: hypothetical protein GY877_06145 [Hyphomicrobium sp.]|nr:hypothetical protein [Hyphomicrobium sp.]
MNVNQQLAKPLNDMIRGAQIQVPEQIREMVEEGLKNTRTSWDAISSSLNDAAAVQTNATQALGDQVVSNMTTNIDATLDAVQALTKARTLSDVQSIQAKFVQDHMARMMKQWNEWMSLSMKVGQDTAATVSSMATTATRTAKR